jgi:HEAT repeat protein
MVSGLVVVCGCKVSDPEGRSPVVAWLAKLFPESPAEKRQKLLSKLSSPDADLRREGVLMLGEGESANWKVTIEILTIMAQGDMEEQVRAAAVQVFAKLYKSEKLPEVLIKSSRDRSVLVRRECVLALERRGDEESMDVLLNMLGRDADEGIRSEAARALGNYRFRKAIQGLLGGLDDDEFGVRYRSGESLRKLTGKDFGSDQQAWRDWFYRVSDPFMVEGE